MDTRQCAKLNKIIDEFHNPVVKTDEMDDEFILEKIEPSIFKKEEFIIGGVKND